MQSSVALDAIGRILGHGQRAADPPIVVRTVILGTLGLALLASVLHPSYGIIPFAERLRGSKLLDPALIVAFALVATLRAIDGGCWRVASWKVLLAACLAILVAAGVLGALLNGNPPYYAAQAMFFLVRPAALLLLFTAFRWDPARPGALWTPVLGYSAVNICVVAGEAVTVARGAGKISADVVIGLFNDAHQQATFSFTIALLLLGCGCSGLTWRRRCGWAALVAGNMMAGYLSQGQKATGIVVSVLVLAGGIRLLQSRRRLRRALVAAAVLVLATTLVAISPAGSATGSKAVAMVTGNLFSRIDKGRYQVGAFVHDIGVVRMFGDYLQIARDTPQVLLVGLGPGSFGSPAALTRVSTHEAPPDIANLFWWENADVMRLKHAGQLRLLGLSAKTSVIGVALGEYGCLGLGAFVCLFLWPLFITGGSTDVDARRRLFWLKLAYVALMLQSILSTLGAWDNDVVLTLLMAGFASFVASRGPEAVVTPAGCGRTVAQRA